VETGEVGESREAQRKFGNRRLHCSRKVFQGVEPLYGRTGCNCLTTTVGAIGAVPTAAAGITVEGTVVAEIVVVVVAPTLVAELEAIPGPTPVSVMATMLPATFGFTAVPKQSLVGAVFCEGAEVEVEPNSKPTVAPRLGLTGPTSGTMVDATPTPTGVECAYPKVDEGPIGTNT